MAATTSFFLNSFSNYGIKSSSLQGTSGTIEVNGTITMRNDKRFGSIVSSMPDPTVRTISPQQTTMLDQKITSSSIVLDHGFERMVRDNFVFRQSFHIKSYEIGPDGTTSIETLMNHMQETSINHIKATGLLHDGFGLSPEMCKKNLIWVMTNVRLVVDRYPIWGDVVQIDTWKSASGKNGMCTNWMFSDCKTSEILIRASCNLVMMNKLTRRLSKFPKEVRDEFEQYFVNLPSLVKPDTRAWLKRDGNFVDHICSGLVPRRSDLDLNQHVSNVKYIGWILESVPKNIVENYELTSMNLEYRRECTKENMLQSHTFVIGKHKDEIVEDDYVDCEHLLQLDIGGGGAEIMKGRTRWRSKYEK